MNIEFFRKPVAIGDIVIYGHQSYPYNMDLSIGIVTDFIEEHKRDKLKKAALFPDEKGDMIVRTTNLGTPPKPGELNHYFIRFSQKTIRFTKFIKIDDRQVMEMNILPEIKDAIIRLAEGVRKGVKLSTLLKEIETPE